jgi:hypothetical protein
MLSLAKSAIVLEEERDLMAITLVVVNQHLD